MAIEIILNTAMTAQDRKGPPERLQRTLHEHIRLQRTALT